LQLYGNFFLVKSNIILKKKNLLPILYTSNKKSLSILKYKQLLLKKIIIKNNTYNFIKTLKVYIA